MTIKRLSYFILLSIIIALVISVISASMRGSILTIDQELKGFAINFMFSAVISIANQWFFNVISKIFSWTSQPLQRLLSGVVGSFLVTMASLFVLSLITEVFIYNQPLEDFLAQQSISRYWFGMLVTFIMIILYHAFYFYKEIQRQKVNEQKVIARSATAQFDALKNQLDPHFLFNSLNVLVSLIEENPKAATKFTTSLSKVYRYVLEQRNKELVPVDEELAFARTYVGLLKTRFEDSIQIDIPEKSNIPDAQVVPLSLQLLLENAVKHNVVSDSKPLQLRIYEDRNQLIIENNLQKKSVANSGSGVGLQNIASRYNLLTDRKMSIAQDETHFKVQIPILTKEPELVTQKEDTMNTVEDIKLIQAKERLKSIKEFYDGIVKGVGIILFLAVINYFTSDFPWVIFPIIGITIGTFFSYLRTFENNIFLGKGWEERKINELMNDKNF